ncbi:hypothetical protein B5X24_HaOG200578 [Helicoverpa armigera]|nr:hypothetical protein B5X24_HaOG200578 [Helicoverpa armigera]
MPFIIPMGSAIHFSTMKKRYRNSIILLTVLNFIHCICYEIVFHEIKINPVALINEFTAVIDILSSEKAPDNEDVHLNITDLIVKYGYPVEQHHAKTDDDYILTMFRIPRSGPAVFLMHGMLLSSDDWVTNGPHNSLPYLLAMAGYDVWLGNARGNKHSRQHAKISPDTPEFWNFSWDEIGRYDLPTMIDYVLSTAKTETLAYVGYSQGTTNFFVMGSERPEYNDKVSTMIALAPVAWSSHMKSPFARMTAPLSYYATIIIKMLQMYEILPKPINYLYKNTPLCNIGNGIVCSTILFILGGFDYEQINQRNLPVIFGHMPSGASINQITHYLQNMMSGKFQKFDHGEDKNVQLYGTRKPPSYAVDKIRTPVALFYGENDWFSDVKDVKILNKKLPNVVDLYHVPLVKCNHVDFLWAKDATRLIYARVLELLRFGNKTNGLSCFSETCKNVNGVDHHLDS